MAPLMTLQQACGWIAARELLARLVGAGSTALVRVHTDSRSLQAGDLFVALQGERFDAHAFLPQARTAGAAAALAHGGLAAAGLGAQRQSKASGSVGISCVVSVGIDLAAKHPV